MKACLIAFLYMCLLIKCGRVKRVIGGTAVECGKQPDVASLRNSSNLKHLCGATVISPRFALTAAHCVTSKADEYVLKLNNVCVKDHDIAPSATILEIIINQSYDPVTRAHDIAILRFAVLDDITWLKHTLPRSSFGLSGECAVYGYGYRDVRTKETSEILLAGTLRIISLDECERRLGPFVTPKYDHGMLCATGDGIDACQGDSGSPLICAGGTVEGISSYGMSCAVPGIPGVYTSVGFHLEWIRKVIKDEWN
ncbi:unnamed protein product [Arctia plantaginis]|uniref:Peptidase S1 domain-containing protein n=1 Tax=Arctia plantaginis TaxID=874455 RepID=A0A8S0YT35_ARCPL|nr:unnamed protein product [Arctia plantaginis]CAB3261466.1 unnamed protein product [Arctia plantaginis]